MDLMINIEMPIDVGVDAMAERLYRHIGCGSDHLYQICYKK